MIDGAPQTATHGSELILVQLVAQRHHPTTNVPMYEWRGEAEHKTFWSLLRNAGKQNKALCQGYVWKRLHEDDHIPTKLTPIPVEQRAEFYGEDCIRVMKDERILRTRIPERSTKTSRSRHSWRNPDQSHKGWFGGSSRKPASPKANKKATSTAKGSKDQDEQVPVIPIPDEVEPAPEQVEPLVEPAETATALAAEEVEPTAPAVDIRIEPALLEPMELPPPVQPPQLDDPANRPTTSVTLQQSYNMINESWQCLAQHTFGAQHANAVLEAKVISLEQATPKLMTEIMKRITHIYEKLNENDTNLGGQLNIIKEDVNLFMDQLDEVKIAADHVKNQTIERMAVYETHQQQQQEQIEALKKQIKALETIIRLMYDADDKQSPDTSSAATPAQSK
eukprot:3193595-Amphidinium_carterae.1